MQTRSVVSGVLLLLCICGLLPLIALAENNQSLTLSSTNQVEIYSGSIPSGDGIVSIKSVSGKLYQIPAMTPLGVIQALAGMDSIDTYKIGDELISKRGILTLDGINDYSNTGEKSWFVLVNDKQLQDYLLPAEDGLNSFTLKPGDVILFAFGNPTKSSSEATAIVRITIGAKSDVVGQIKPAGTSTSTPVPTPLPLVTPTVVSTPVTPQTLEPSPKITPSPVAVTVPVNEPIQTPSTQTKDPNQPVYEGSGGKSTVTTTETPSTRTKDPNQPVYEGSEGKSTVTTTETSSTQTKDPNQPVYEGSGGQSTATTTETSSTQTKDPNQPVYEGSGGKSEVLTNVSETVKPDVTSENSKSENPDEQSGNTPAEIPTLSSNISKSGQAILYEGSVSLPSGNINVSADSGAEYNEGSDTPLGLLQTLQTGGKVSSISVNDRALKRGGHLVIDGIGDYSRGEEAWFVQINGVTLQEYTNPGTDAVDVRKVKTGDKISYFYGKQDQTAESAKAAIYITIQ